MRSFVLAALLLSVPRPAIADAEAPKVAVIPSIAVNVDAARVDALGQDLADALNAELLVAASGGLEVRRRLPVEGLPPDCVAKPACIADVARRTGAAQLLFIVVVDTGANGAVQIDSTWIDPATGVSAPRPAIDLAPAADPRSRFVAAARALLPDAAVRPKPKLDGTMAPAVPRHVTRPALIAASVGAVGLGLGIGFGLAARSKYGECDVDLPATMCADDGYRSSLRRRALIADVGFVIGLGGAATAVVLYLTSAKESKLVVEPTPGGAQVSAVGRF